MKRFLPASLLLHVLLLGALAARIPQPPKLALRTLSLELPAARPAPQAAQSTGSAAMAVARTGTGMNPPAQRPIRHRSQRTTPVDPARLARTDPAGEPLPRQTPQRRTDTPAPAHGPAATDPSAAASTQEDAVTSQVRAVLYAALRARFVYPRRARLRGWQGTVRVGVRVGAAGQILQLRIVESSHHAVLDRAALDCLDRIRQVPGVVAWLNGRARDIVVPIEYRLTNG